jgi:hypothetical protein
MQVSILNGIYTDAAPDLRSSYPRNYVPVPKQNGIATGYLKPAEGLVQVGGAAPGIGRGGINWGGTLYRVLGSKLCSVGPSGTITVLGEVGGGLQVSMDMGFDRLAIVSAGCLFYWNGSTLTQVTDPDLGNPIDLKWMAGYYVTTDGTYIVVTDINEPTSVSPLKYGSVDADPGPIKAIDELRNELYAFGRYVIQPFDNVGGDFFPFEAVEGALVPKGIIGTHAYCSIGNTFVFCGSGRGEAPAIYMMIPGDTVKLSTREIDRILLDYSEAVLSQCVMEAIVDRNQQRVLLHLPDQCLVYDTIASKIMSEPIWYTLDSGIGSKSMYRARNWVWCYDQWCVEDPTSAILGQTTDTVSTHYGSAIGWEFGTTMLYNEGNDAILLEKELVGLPGRAAFGADPVVWGSHSFDGETWSRERPVRAGVQGDRARRLAWRLDGRIRNYRIEKFRGTSDAHLPVIRLEVKVEPLFTRPGNG